VSVSQIEERGEGVTGLTRAVMYAGSPAAVVSLWSVSDQAKKDLMVSFYRHILVDGLPKSEALRAAKLEILKGKTKFHISDKVEVSISHPFFWAAFVMYGE
jgi:CHAT domain-containing protein